MQRGVTILMPCLNEEKTLPICIEKALKFLETSGIPGEVMIADNGSTDNSIEIAQKMGAVVVNIPYKGYGSALRGGIEAANYEYVIMGDADDSYDFLDLQKYIDKLDEGYDLVMGNRFWGGIEPGAMSFSHKYIGNPVLSGIGRIFFRTGVRDFHCGQRGFRKDSIMALGLNTTGMEFASEMVVKASLNKLKMTEVPCKLYPDGRDRPPHLRSIPDGWRHLKFLLIYSPKWLFFYPGLAMILLGLVMIIALYIHPIHIGRIQFEVTTMFYFAMLLLMGIQSLQFSVYTNVYGRRIGQFPDTGALITGIARFMGGKGLALGALLMIVGLAGMIISLTLWGQVGFGEVDNTFILRTAILFGTAFVLGVNSILSGFFINVLNMGLEDNK
ncbi:MAG: glycosyltransferase family 2 protein [Lachnospiraceae bacterium]|nr:glycosyltransferase family 2 protein [Lachnospiraceae bacterium]